MTKSKDIALNKNTYRVVATDIFYEVYQVVEGRDGNPGYKKVYCSHNANRCFRKGIEAIGKQMVNQVRAEWVSAK